MAVFNSKLLNYQRVAIWLMVKKHNVSWKIMKHPHMSH